MSLVLYDLYSDLTPKQWAPNPMKARAMLNYKGIPFTTKFVTYTELPHVLEAAGATPWREVPHYTLPAITYGGVCVMGLDEIRDFLNDNFPDTPKVECGCGEYSPRAEEVVHAAMIEVAEPVACCTAPKALPEEDQEYFASQKLPRMGVDMEAVLASPATTQGMWRGVEQLLNSGLYRIVAGVPSPTNESALLILSQALVDEETDGVDLEQVGRIRRQKFLTGETPRWVDFQAFAIAYWCQKIIQLDPHRPVGDLIHDEWMKGWYNRMAVYST